MNIYLITTFRLNDKSHKYPIQDARSVGFYVDAGTAYKAVRHNWCNIYEYAYPYAVVECIEEGLYSRVKSRDFYHYNDKEDKYEWILEPIQLKDIPSIGAIG